MQSSQQSKKILAVSIDFDGCLGNSKFADYYQQLIAKYRSSEWIPAEEYKIKLSLANSVLIEHIKKLAKNYDELVWMVGSNRQSAYKDQHENDHNKNGSTYLALTYLAEILNQETQKTSTVHKHTVFDSILKQSAGYNFDLKENQILENQILEQYSMSGDIKYRLSFLQIHDVCGSHPQDQISYVHIDDREDINIPSSDLFSNKEMASYLPLNLQQVSIINYQTYNPIARLQLFKNNFSQEMSADIKNEINSIIELIKQDVNILIQLEKNHKNQLDSLQNEKKILEGMSPRNRAREMSIDNTLAQFDNARHVLMQLNQFTFSNNLHDDIILLNKIMNQNIRSKNLPLEIKIEYENQKKIIYHEVITPYPGFKRNSAQPSTGMLIPQFVFDRIVEECSKDDFVQHSSASKIDLVKKIADYSQATEVLEYIKQLQSFYQKVEKNHKWNHDKDFATLIKKLEKARSEPNALSAMLNIIEDALSIQQKKSSKWMSFLLKDENTSTNLHGHHYSRLLGLAINEIRIKYPKHVQLHSAQSSTMNPYSQLPHLTSTQEHENKPEPSQKTFRK